jgi:LuxR family maltose regulon positive regulatory protein
MGTPLLTTKLYVPPPRPNLVRRHSLIRRLDDGLRLGHRLSLISAPAGFGKTTLVIAWLQQLQPGIRVGWLSLDEGDNEVSHFLNYLVAALQTVESNLGEAVESLLRSPRLPPLENLITLLINDLAELSDQAVLILDDYHIVHNLNVHKALTFLLDNLPSQFHLVLVSREDPVLPLHRLRGQGQVTEIHAMELRFSEDEAALFLNQVMGLDLTPDNIATLERRTEGWVTGLQLAAISMRGVADKQGFIEAFAGDDRYVADYLIAEVIDRQAAAIKQFLLTTSVLDRFTVSLCDALIGGQQGRDILSQLEQADLFIIPLDKKREWYRYHHLFGQLLRYRLREEAGAEGIQQLRRRAAAWCIQHDLIEEAIHHRLAAEDWSGAADLIESIGLRLVGQGRLARVLSWIEALPGDFVLSRPLLCIQHAWVLNLTG